MSVLAPRGRGPVRCQESDATQLEGMMAPSPPSPEATAALAAAEAPMQFDMINREWQQLSQQDNFDGFRIEAANAVTKYIQAAHTLFMGTQMRECGYIYQFGPAFQSEDQRTVLVARCGLDGGVNGRVIQKLGQSWDFKASTNSHLKDPQRNMHEGSLDYNGKTLAFGGKLAWQGAWLLGGAMTRKITPSLYLGGDLTIVAVNGVTSIGQIGARWCPSSKDVFTAAVSRTPDPKSPMGTNLHECRFQYVRRLSERLSLGSEFKISHPDRESAMSLAYEYTFRNSRIQGLLDSEGKVSCCVSDFTGFGFSGMIDYVRSDYKFGIVMHVLPQPEGQPPQ